MSNGCISGPIFGLAVSQVRRENMLISALPRRPNRERVRHIKEALLEALSLPDGTMVTVTELACLEEGCAPIETVVCSASARCPAAATQASQTDGRR